MSNSVDTKHALDTIYEAETLARVIEQLHTFINKNEAILDLKQMGFRIVRDTPIYISTPNNQSCHRVLEDIYQQILMQGFNAYLTDGEKFENVITNNTVSREMVCKVLTKLLQEKLDKVNDQLEQLNIEPVEADIRRKTN